MKPREEGESPSDLSEDAPPALFNMVSETYEGSRKGHTDTIHGVTIWNALVSPTNAADQGTEMLTTARTMNMAWYAWMLLTRSLIGPEETRSIHIPTAMTVENAANCKKAENAKAIYSYKEPLRLERHAQEY